MARALSFTDDGAWPSTQLTAESAVWFVAGVADQLTTPVAIIQILMRATGWDGRYKRALRCRLEPRASARRASAGAYRTAASPRFRSAAIWLAVDIGQNALLGLPPKIP